MDHPVVEWQAAGGAQVDADSHGELNLGVRRGDFSFLLRTDAPELRWDPSGEHGRAWVDLRGHGFAAAMLISPWTDGAPDPARALSAASVGAEAGALRYGPAGLYAGGRVAVDHVFFGTMPDSSAEIPLDRTVANAELLAGLYREGLQGWLRGGVDLSLVADSSPSPSYHGATELHWLPKWTMGRLSLAPRAELWAGLGVDQDFLTKTHLGGLNPWVVPLAGAAWAEFWVENYGVLRLGPTVGLGEGGSGGRGFRVSPFADLAAFDGQTEAGLGLGMHTWRGRLYLDVTGGYSPTVLRQPGVSAGSVWFSLGVDWGAGKALSKTGVPGPPGQVWPG